jgi:transcriptional regulator with XRE-family HTH domain
MYSISLKELGNRMKQIRNHLGLNQTDLALRLQCKQVAISRLENGLGGTAVLLASLLSFYSQYIYIHYIFAETFYLVSTDDKEICRSNLDSVILKIIDNSVKQHEVDTVELNKKLKSSLDKAIELLKE